MVPILSVAAWAQGSNAAGKADISRLHHGKPDVTGVADPLHAGYVTRRLRWPPVHEWAEQDFKNYQPARFDSTGHCLF